MSPRMVRIVRLSSIGEFAALVGGQLLEIGSRNHWANPESLIAEATAAGYPVSPYVMDTSHVVGRYVRPAAAEGSATAPRYAA